MTTATIDSFAWMKVFSRPSAVHFHLLRLSLVKRDVGRWVNTIFRLWLSKLSFRNCHSFWLVVICCFRVSLIRNRVTDLRTHGNFIPSSTSSLVLWLRLRYPTVWNRQKTRCQLEMSSRFMYSLRQPHLTVLPNRPVSAKAKLIKLVSPASFISKLETSRFSHDSLIITLHAAFHIGFFRIPLLPLRIKLACLMHFFLFYTTISYRNHVTLCLRKHLQSPLEFNLRTASRLPLMAQSLVSDRWSPLFSSAKPLQGQASWSSGTKRLFKSASSNYKYSFSNFASITNFSHSLFLKPNWLWMRYSILCKLN